MKHIDFGSTDMIKLRAICISATLRCSLRCKLCNVQAPYNKNPYHPTYEHLLKEADAIFNAISFIQDFNISGGEPFLRDDLGGVIAYLFANHKEKIGRLRIFTNGTKLPPPDIFEEARKWGNDFKIVVDKYIVSDKCNDIANILESENIPFEIRDYTTDLHCNGWVDFGNLDLKHEDAKMLFQKCAVKQGYYLAAEDGKFFPCYRMKLLQGSTSDYVDLFANEPKEKIIQRLVSLLSQEHYNSCKYCNGIHADSKRYLPAEQL